MVLLSMESAYLHPLSFLFPGVKWCLKWAKCFGNLSGSLAEAATSARKAVLLWIMLLRDISSEPPSSESAATCCCNQQHKAQLEPGCPWDTRVLILWPTLFNTFSYALSNRSQRVWRKCQTGKQRDWMALLGGHG